MWFLDYFAWSVADTVESLIIWVYNQEFAFEPGIDLCLVLASYPLASVTSLPLKHQWLASVWVIVAIKRYSFIEAPKLPVKSVEIFFLTFFNRVKIIPCLVAKTKFMRWATIKGYWYFILIVIAIFILAPGLIRGYEFTIKWLFIRLYLVFICKSRDTECKIETHFVCKFIFWGVVTVLNRFRESICLVVTHFYYIYPKIGC